MWNELEDDWQECPELEVKRFSESCFAQLKKYLTFRLMDIDFPVQAGKRVFGEDTYE